MTREEILTAAHEILNVAGVREVESFLQYEGGEENATDYILSKIAFAWDEDEDMTEERMIRYYALMGITIKASSERRSE